jgi:hypothetical protein
LGSSSPPPRELIVSTSSPELGSASPSSPKPMSDPLFAFSLYPLVICAAIGLLIAGPLTFLFPTSLLLWLVTVSCVGFILFALAQPVRHFKFYDEHFELTGKGTRIREEYSTILRLEESKQRKREIRISIRGRDKPLLIPANPKNEKLNIDLYSWLQGKLVGNSRIVRNDLEKDGSNQLGN